MPVIAFSIVVQILCAVHCVRNSRSPMWLTLIIFLSIPGCFAYLVFEVLPQYAGRREVRAARIAAVRKLDPEREVRQAREALEVADTAANHIGLGEALADAGRWGEAVGHYRSGLAKTAGSDRGTQVKLARALLESGDPDGARAVLEPLPPSGSAAENDRAALLLARAFDDSGKKERALALYRELGERMAGGEALCREAALLLAEGRRSEALAPLEEVEKRLKRLDRLERARDADMYDWAARTLAELRA